MINGKLGIPLSKDNICDIFDSGVRMCIASRNKEGFNWTKLAKFYIDCIEDIDNILLRAIDLGLIQKTN
jgi:hypothetical protein